MLWLRKSKKGFTLIEMMVVLAIIGVLAGLGARFYGGEIDKAKNAVVKANVGTIRTIIQGELINRTIDGVEDMYDGTDVPTLFANSGIHNPYTGSAQTANGTAGIGGNPGDVYVTLSDNVFFINGNNADKTDVYVTSLKAIK